MIPLSDLFETHLTVQDLKQSMAFYGQTLGLELADVSWERRVAFYWIGGRGNAMLGLWETGTGPQKLSLHLAFRVDLEDVLEAPARLRAAHVDPLGFHGEPAAEPVVIAWMPAASSISATRMGTCSSCWPCCPTCPNPNWESSVGPSGTSA